MNFVAPRTLLLSVLVGAPTAPALAAFVATDGDALALLQGGLERQSTPPHGALKHTLRCGGAATGSSGMPYMVDGGSSGTKTRGKGVGYYFSKSRQDRDLRMLAHWGTIVAGIDQGDGWLQVGDCYLPMWLEGTQVIKPVGGAADSKSSKGAEPADPYLAGDALEVWSKRAGTWYACTVTGKGSDPGTYNVRVHMAPEGRKDTPAVPAALLRAPAVAGAPVFADGDLADLRASASATAPLWIPCTVEGKGRLPGTYRIRLDAQPQGEPAFAVPATWLWKRGGSGRGRPTAAVAEPPRAQPEEEGAVPAALRRLHASYAEIRQLLDAETLPAS